MSQVVVLQRDEADTRPNPIPVRRVRKNGNRKRVELQERDLRALRYVHEQKFLTYEQLLSIWGSSVSYAEKRVRKLVRMGFLETQQVYTEPKPAYLLGKEGHKALAVKEMTGDIRRASTIDLRSFPHDAVVNDIRSRLRELGYSRWWSERNLRHRIGSQGGPDGAFKWNGQHIALEYERSRKTLRRYIQVIRRYEEWREFDWILFIVESPEDLAFFEAELPGLVRHKDWEGNRPKRVARFRFVLRESFMRDGLMAKGFCCDRHGEIHRGILATCKPAEPPKAVAEVKPKKPIPPSPPPPEVRPPQPAPAPAKPQAVRMPPKKQTDRWQWLADRSIAAAAEWFGTHMLILGPAILLTLGVWLVAVPVKGELLFGFLDEPIGNLMVWLHHRYGWENAVFRKGYAGTGAVLALLGLIWGVVRGLRVSLLFFTLGVALLLLGVGFELMWAIYVGLVVGGLALGWIVWWLEKED